MEARALILYEWVRSTSVYVIHVCLQIVYSEEVMSGQRVESRCRVFRERGEIAGDEVRSGDGSIRDLLANKSSWEILGL
ncbi:hypothetical protein TNCV_2038291 [Trichonephila clavipes]|nr:hypothetical protein TNCV_2038291 [Trichonephila clavipes]